MSTEHLQNGDSLELVALVASVQDGGVAGHASGGAGRPVAGQAASAGIPWTRPRVVALVNLEARRPFDHGRPDDPHAHNGAPDHEQIAVHEDEARVLLPLRFGFGLLEQTPSLVPPRLGLRVWFLHALYLTVRTPADERTVINALVLLFRVQGANRALLLLVPLFLPFINKL